MSEQFENPAEAKVANETVVDSTAQETIERIAEKAAAKPAQTTEKSDKEHKIFTI